jgi:hypothetical protein
MRRKYRYKERKEYEEVLSKVELELLISRWVASHRWDKKAPEIKVTRGNYTLEIWEGAAYDYGQFTYHNPTNGRPSVDFVEVERWLHTWKEHYRNCPLRRTDEEAVIMWKLYTEVDRKYREFVQKRIQGS